MGNDNWVEVGKIDEVPRQGARVVSRAEGDIAVFRTVDDEIFALRDKCPHKGGPLSQGIVHGKRVACPLHDWKIQLACGEAVAPDKGCARSYRVRVKAGAIFLMLQTGIRVTDSIYCRLQPQNLYEGVF